VVSRVGDTVASRKVSNGASLGFEEKLFATADKLRGHLDPAEYKHVVLGLVFLKYISDAFAERHRALLEEEGVDPEDRDEYLAENVFWVPPEARWAQLQAEAKQPTIGKLIDDAMVAIEKENPSLRGVLPKDYARGARRPETTLAERQQHRSWIDRLARERSPARPGCSPDAGLWTAASVTAAARRGCYSAWGTHLEREACSSWPQSRPSR
jgi:type I restriction-modification system DNA methylase subunit